MNKKSTSLLVGLVFLTLPLITTAQASSVSNSNVLSILVHLVTTLTQEVQGIVAQASSARGQSAAAAASVATAPLYNFGGMYGYGANGTPYPNPATGSASCPSGYSASQVLGTVGEDWPVYFCYQTQTATSQSFYNFGGMYGYGANDAPYPNPATGSASCPSGYSASQVLGSSGEDWPLYFCYQANNGSNQSLYNFGGMYGYGSANAFTYKTYPNPATGSGSCPSGYSASQVLYTFGEDWPVEFCYQANPDYSPQVVPVTNPVVTPVRAAIPTLPTTSSAFITDLYSCVLGRQPASPELSYWLAEPSSTSIATFYSGFFDSQEYKNDATSNQQYVNQLYNCVLFRAPDAGGTATWLAALTTGMSRDTVLSDFLTSTEFMTLDAPGIEGAIGFSAPVQMVASLNQNDPMTWLIKSVCVDPQNKVLPVDPYGGCPVGSTIRKMLPTDPMPYNNYDLADQQVHDAVPVPDLSGNTLALVYFDWIPFHQFNLTDGSDGWDVYGVQGGWAGGLLTKDGVAFSQVFTGANCTIGDGWVFFPATGFLSGGSATVGIGSNFWEHNQQSYPGSCDGTQSNTSDAYAWDANSVLTTWKLIPNYTFGGENGKPTKSMDTMVSYHGNTGHVEVFYFTREYGITRWEAWQPVSQGFAPGGDCLGPTTMTYDNTQYTRTDCRDFSDVAAAPSPQFPIWPIPNINLLQHAHFDNGGGYSLAIPSGQGTGLWYRGGDSAEGNLINWSFGNSTSPDDVNSVLGTLKGVRYLSTNCGGTCTGAGVQELYQEVPISKFVSNANYAYGADVRTQSGQGAMQITLQEIDSQNNQVLWQDSQVASVTTENGPAQSADQLSSVYLTSGSIYKTVQIPILPGATVIRYYFTPLTSNVTFDILDAWLAPWPKPSEGYGTLSGVKPLTVAPVPGAPANLSGSCFNHAASYSWSAVSGATSYNIQQKDTASGGTWGYVSNSPSFTTSSGLYGSYSWSVAACNVTGCSSPVSGTTISCST